MNKIEGNPIHEKREKYLEAIEHLKTGISENADPEVVDKAFEAYEHAVKEMPLEFDAENLTLEESDILLEAKFLAQQAVAKGLHIPKYLEELAAIASKAQHGFKLPIETDEHIANTVETDSLRFKSLPREVPSDTKAEESIADVVDAADAIETARLNRKLHSN
jgi:hypothetical protein